jgi:hypothetical protein
MMDLLAQSGSGGSNWLNVIPPRLIITVLVLSFAGIAAVVKKAKEARAKRDAELRRQQRSDQILRTGRSDGAPPELPNVASPTTRPATAEDARKKLQELAERRRRELAEMMRRAQEGKASAPAPVANSPQSRPLPRPMPQPMRSAPPAAPRPAPRPVPQQQRPVITPPRTMAEEAARRKQQAEAKRRAEREAAARRQVAEEQKNLREASARQAREVRDAAPAAAAYQVIPTTRPDASARQIAASGALGSALARIGGSSSAGDWRKAIILSELLHQPVGLRPLDQRTM